METLPWNKQNATVPPQTMGGSVDNVANSLNLAKQQQYYKQ